MGGLSVVNPNEPMYADQHLSVDFFKRSVTVAGSNVPLTRNEFDLLALMVRDAGQIIPRDALLMEVWNYAPDTRTRTLDVHMLRLRKKLGLYANGGIETIFGIGYRFQPRHDARCSPVG